MPPYSHDMASFQVSLLPKTLIFKQPAGTSRGIYRERKLWYVELHDEQHPSLIGIGECAPLPQLSCDDVPEYEDVLRSAARFVEANGAIPFEQLRNYPSILMGFETAFRSFEACRDTGSPFLLYDTPFSRGEAGITINGLVWMGSFEEMFERMEEKLSAGFRCVKLKIGAIDFERELALLHALRKRYTAQDLEIRVDANGAFSPNNAMEHLRRLAPYHLHSIEQPIAAGQWEEMARLCRETPIPIALDEELIGVNSTVEKVALLDTIRPQYIILKPSLHGGFAGTDEWIALAKEHGIGYWATSALESNIGLNAIAQWCATYLSESSEHLILPQGLGTGQLFENNHESVTLSVEGEKLWLGTPEERAFRQEVKRFQQEWLTPAKTLVVHTSGSTGKPQPIEVEKAKMAASAQITLDFLQLQKGDTALLCLPLQFIAGKMMMVRAMVGNLHLIPSRPSSHPLKHLLTPPTFLAVTPMQALNSLREPQERELFIRIPKVIIGGGGISEELLSEVQACEGAVYSTYGMTETLSHIAMRRLNGNTTVDRYTPLANVQVRLNEKGCLVIDAPTVCNDTLETNDLAEINSDGTFRILGRIDNVVCSGGLKLQLEELEAKLSSLPLKFILTAVPDDFLGEALTLLHEPTNLNVAELCKALLPPHECPRHFFAVDSLPFTETEKPARVTARTLAIGLRNS